MDNPKGLMQVLWELKFMDTSKDICNYYKIRRKQDNYDYWYAFERTDAELTQLYRVGDTTSNQ